MAVRTKIDSIAKDISLIVSNSLAPAAQSKAVADFARSAIADADETNRRILGRIPPRTVTVDGSRGAALDGVRANGGRIIVGWELISDVMAWIGQTLRDRSPVISGDYRDGHTLFADGVEIPRGQQIPDASEYTFLNLVPYARRIEIGKTKAGRDFVIQVPNRIYERTAKDAQARFGNIARIKMTYRAPFSGRLLNYVPVRSGRHAAAAHERSLRVPAIVISLKAT